MTTTTDLHDDIRFTLAEAGFAPIDDTDELDLTAHTVSVLAYFAEAGFDAYRLEVDGTATLARWSEDGIDVLSVNAHGEHIARATFTFSARGHAWLAAVVAAG